MENTYSNRSHSLNHKKLLSQLKNAGVFILTALWSYAVFAKLADFGGYLRQMSEHPFSANVTLVLTYAVPIFELLSAYLLILNKHKLGLWISLLLLIGFTIYVTLILCQVLPKVPCSCGGFISKMSWKNHLYFNLSLICLNIFCLYQLTKKERRLTGKE